MEQALALKLSESLKEVRRTLAQPSIDIILSKEFGSTHAKTCNGWREKLELEIQNKNANGGFNYSVSHSNLLGGAAFLNSTEGAIGFDVEMTSRVLEAVALRVSDTRQLAKSPSPATLFVAKEAAFKALRGLRQPQVLSEVEIIEWQNCSLSLQMYKFISRLKGSSFQWFGVCFELNDHTVALSVIPLST